MTDKELDDFVSESIKKKETQTENADESSELKNPPTAGKNSKALSEVSLGDVQFSLDKSKTYEEQAEDVVNAMAIANAVKDDNFAKDLTEKKAEELKNKADSKVKKAKKENIDAETDLQKAQRELYEAVLQSFGIYKHLPIWLMVGLVCLLSPLYAALTFLIGFPCAIIKILIDNLDGIVCRYEESDEKSQPKIKVICWILLALTVIFIICMTILKCLNKI